MPQHNFVSVQLLNVSQNTFDASGFPKLFYVHIYINMKKNFMQIVFSIGNSLTVNTFCKVLADGKVDKIYVRHRLVIVMQVNICYARVRNIDIILQQIDRTLQLLSSHGGHFWRYFQHISLNSKELSILRDYLKLNCCKTTKAINSEVDVPLFRYSGQSIASCWTLKLIGRHNLNLCTIT